MSETDEKYKTEIDEAMAMINFNKGQPAAIITPSRKELALNDNGLTEVVVWGWVKKSANFVKHLRKLKGAKLSVFDCICLTINEKGVCDLTVLEISKLTGYSRQEVMDSTKELEEMGYLSVNRDAKKNLYKPIFVARGASQPNDESSNLTNDESSGLDSFESSPAEEKVTSSIKELKELNIYTSDDFKKMSPIQAQKIPTLQLYKNATGFFPGSVVWEYVHCVILNHKLTYEAINKAAIAWTMEGYKKENIRGILDWAVNGIPELTNGKKQPQKTIKNGGIDNSVTQSWLSKKQEKREVVSNGN